MTPGLASPAHSPAGVAAFDVTRIRRDFPILAQQVNGKPLVYLDSAASGQRPRQVIDAVTAYEEHDHANIHRGVHTLSVRATAAYEAARDKVAQFVNAARREEIIFVRGTTEAINLVAQAYGRPRLRSGDEIILTRLEHHSNIVPWQMLCEQTGARIRVVPVNRAGELVTEEYEKLLSDKTKIVAFGHVSNALGTINPVRRMTELAHARGAVTVIDGAQAAPHLPIDVRAIGADFYAFSGHKAFGPTGIGALYGRFDLLENMAPYQGGGEMISSVSFEKTEYNVVPHKFEAGTPNISGAVGLGAAVDYVRGIGFPAMWDHEHALLLEATRRLKAIPQVRLVGEAREKASVISFVIDGVHPHDVGTVLDQAGVAVRAGHHCAQPLMEHYGISGTVRASLALYNTMDELDALLAGVREAIELFGE